MNLEKTKSIIYARLNGTKLTGEQHAAIQEALECVQIVEKIRNEADEFFSERISLSDVGERVINILNEKSKVINQKNYVNSFKVYRTTYTMGGIATGGFFESLVVASRKENIKGLLNETHDESVSNLKIEESDIDPSFYRYEEVLTTVFA